MLLAPCTIQILEQCQDFDQLTISFEQLAVEKRLSSNERASLSVAFKNAASSRRAALTAVSQAIQREKTEQSPNTEKLAVEYQNLLQSELRGICSRAISLALKLADSADSPEAMVSYLKIQADHLRYLAELDAGFSSQAEEAYAKAYAIAFESLHASDPLRLGLGLNKAVFEMEITRDLKKACGTAREVFESGTKKAGELSGPRLKVAAGLLQRLRDNLTLWTTMGLGDR